MFDLLFRDGRIVDGLGTHIYAGDVGVRNGKIVAVGNLEGTEAARTVDCGGLYLSPGWVDIHGHADWNVLEYSIGLNLLRQGLTLTVAGNCGGAPAPMIGRASEMLKKGQLSEDVTVELMHQRYPESLWSMDNFLDEVESSQPALNYVQLAGHNMLRHCAMGDDERRALPEEVERMKVLLQECLEQGAFGMSSGLVFIPGCWSDTGELIELAKVVARHSGLYASHIRGERETSIEATQEFIRIVEGSGARGQVSHMQSKFPVLSRGVMKVEMLSAARARGADVACDYEAYTGTELSLAGCLQIYHFTREQLLDKVRKPEGRADLKRTMRTIDPWHPLGRFGPGGVPFRRAWYRVRIWDCPHDRGLEGKTIAAVAAERGIDAEDALFSLFLAEDGYGPRLVQDYIEDEHFNILPWEFCIMPSVDTGLFDPANQYSAIDYRYWREVGSPGPIGVAPRVLGQYVREEKIVSLEEAIRRMTSLAMQRLGIVDRGIIRPGMWADLVVFDRDTIALRSPNADPEVAESFWPHGIAYVTVNGEIAIDHNEYMGVRAGKVLRASYNAQAGS